MIGEQVLLYGVFGVVGLLLLRRYWKMRSIRQYSPQEVRERLHDRNVLLLDVRTDMEHRAQTIGGSLHIPLQQLRRRLQDLDRYRSKEIICFCSSGNRSLTAAYLLRKRGFNTGNLKGGLSQWTFAPEQDQ